MVESRCGILCGECEYKEKMSCAGCIYIEKPFWGDSCPVKDCCEGRGHNHCGQCSEFPCELLNEFAFDKEQGDNGKRIETCRMWRSNEQEIIEKATLIVNDATTDWVKGICTLALIDKDGFPTASTLSLAKADGIKWLSFVTGLNSNKVWRIHKCNKASVCFNSTDYNITLVGTIEILTDPQIKKDAWYEGCEHHFSGADDPNYCVLKFVPHRYCLFIGDSEVEGTLQGSTS